MDPIMPFSQIMQETMESIESKFYEKTPLQKTWETVLASMKVPVDKERLAEHTKVVSCDNGMLIFQTDHPGWAQILNLYSRYITKGFNMRDKKLHVCAMKVLIRNEDTIWCGDGQ